jgi:IS5 family transposase
MLLPKGLKFLKQAVKVLKLEVTGKELNLDSGFDSRRNRRTVWKAGLVPNIPENIRNRDMSKRKRGRKRYFNNLSYNSRSTVERTFAWHDTYRATVIRYSRNLKHFMAHNLLAFTLINLRHFVPNSK